MPSSLDPPPRSWLFVPALGAPELLPKALRSNAEAVVLDLEDAVPQHQKADAVDCVRRALHHRAVNIPIFVRVNPATRGQAALETGLVGEHQLAGLLVPKVSEPVELQPFLEALPTAESSAGRSAPAVIPMIESAAGVLRAAEIAACDPRVIGLAFGAEDLRAELGGVAWLAVRHARAQVALAARGTGRWAIDSPCMDLDRPEQLRREARLAVALGFAGKLAIHPAQLPAINLAFAPSTAELEAAERVLDAWSGRPKDGTAVIVVDGCVVDEPVVAAARRVVSPRPATERDQRDARDARSSEE